MKEGWKTTEFWMGLFGVIFIFLNEQLGWHFEAQTIISAVTMIVGYIASRTILKVKNLAPYNDTGNGGKTNGTVA